MARCFFSGRIPTNVRGVPDCEHTRTVTRHDVFRIRIHGFLRLVVIIVRHVLEPTTVITNVLQQDIATSFLILRAQDLHRSEGIDVQQTDEHDLHPGKNAEAVLVNHAPYEKVVAISSRGAIWKLHDALNIRLPWNRFTVHASRTIDGDGN